jgi:hypothetical protein
MSSPLISQDVVPIGAGYVILMGVLAAGLRLQRRESAAARTADATPGTSRPGTGEPGTGEPASGTRASGSGEPGTGEPASGTRASGSGEPGTRESAPPEPAAVAHTADAQAAVAQAADGSGGKAPSRVARRVRPGWPRFAVQTGGTAFGGYVVLMAVVLLYYYGVARVANQFLLSAFTGCALLLALSLPVFALASWAAVSRSRRAANGDAPAARNARRAPPR